MQQVLNPGGYQYQEGVVRTLPRQPVTVTAEQSMIRDLKSLIEEDFEQAQNRIHKWNKLTTEERVIDYLAKLSTQIVIGQRLIQNTERATAEQAAKLIVLWKCARRRDIKDYFKKLSQTKKEEGRMAYGGQRRRPYSQTLDELPLGA